jgi:hypothetical protein
MKMTTKIPNRPQLEEFLKKLKSLLAAAKASGGKTQRIADELRAEIESEESNLDATDRAALDQLESKKRQLSALEKQIEQERGKADQTYDELRAHLLGNFHDIWQRALQDEYRVAIERVTERLTPLYQSAGHAKQAATNTDLVMYCYTGEFRQYDVGDPSYDQFKVAERIIRKAEAFLAGESPFAATYEEAQSKRAA